MDEIHMDKTEELTHPSDDPYIRGLLAPGGELEWLWDATITLTIDGRAVRRFRQGRAVLPADAADRPGGYGRAVRGDVLPVGRVSARGRRLPDLGARAR